jgi:hypothetical protein
VPSPSQRAAIEAPAEALLVLAGPGAGKTFCLIERIRFLLEQLGMDPSRICAFTFTNKAAGEIAERLARTLGGRAAQVKTGTIHAFCAELLREFGARVGVEKGFGIIDDKQQRAVLRRIGRYNDQWNGPLLRRFSAHRIANEPFRHRNDAEAFEKYDRFLRDRNYADFDTLILKTAELLTHHDVVQRVRARWDCVLVDEFQDLNPLQYQVIRELGREHGHVFAVGDDEQSIYSWAGADPRVFLEYTNDFQVARRITLRENRRCSREILALARRLIEHNPMLFDEPKLLEAERESAFCVSALSFPDDVAERGWLVADLQRDHAEHGTTWGDVALLYRTHTIGDALEASLLTAGIPCRLANGRALAQDPIIAYVLAALQVVAHPDDVHDDAFLEIALPTPLVDDARARLTHTARTLREELEATARELGHQHVDARRLLLARQPPRDRQPACDRDGTGGGAALPSRRDVRHGARGEPRRADRSRRAAGDRPARGATGRRARVGAHDLARAAARGGDRARGAAPRGRVPTGVDRRGVARRSRADPRGRCADARPAAGAVQGAPAPRLRERPLGVPRLHRRRHRDDDERRGPRRGGGDRRRARARPRDRRRALLARAAGGADRSERCRGARDLPG